MLKIQLGSSTRLANLRKLVLDLRLILQIIYLVIFVQLQVSGKTEQNLQVEGIVASLESPAERGYCARDL